MQARSSSVDQSEAKSYKLLMSPSRLVLVLVPIVGLMKVNFSILLLIVKKKKTPNLIKKSNAPGKHKWVLCVHKETLLACILMYGSLDLFLKLMHKQLELLKCFKGKITWLFFNDVMKKRSLLIQFSCTLLISSLILAHGIEN